MLSVESLEPRVRAMVAGDKVKIPPYPAVAMKLQRTIDEGNYGLADLARITSADEVLTAAVLRMANSAAFRGASRITSLSDAIGRLGAGELGRVALAATLGVSATVHGPLAELRRTAWRQSLASALCCQALALARGVSAQDGFVCGLLHDFGRVVAVACLEDVVHREPAEQRLPEEEWRKIVDGLHVELGVMAGARWGLPDMLVSVMASHHDPEQAGRYRGLVDIVCAADTVVGLLEECPYLFARDLVDVPGLRGRSEIDRLMDVVPFIPGYINGLDDMGPPAAAPASSRVEKPSSVLDGPHADVDFPLVWARQNGETTYQARYVTAKGIGFAGKTAMFEGSVARLRVGTGAGAIDLSGRVVLCRPEGRGGYLLEVKLFALPGAAHDAWGQLLDTVGAAA